jgi:hypothetical protein
MANLATNQDIINDALSRADELTDGSSDLADKAIIYLNRSYRELYMGGQSFVPSINETWWWMKQEASLILEGAITSFTVTVSNNSATAVFSGTPSPATDASVSGWFLKVGTHPDLFKISSITGATATLDSVYTGAGAVSTSCRLFKLDYTLSASAIKIIGRMTAYQQGKYQIEGMSLSKLDEEYPMALVANGTPDKFAMVNENTVRFNRYGSATESELTRVDYDYLILPADLQNNTSEPLVPLQYRHILSDMTTFYLMGDKSDTRQENVGLQAKQGIISMARENTGRWTQTGKPGHLYKRQRAVKMAVKRTASRGVIIA